MPAEQRDTLVVLLVEVLRRVELHLMYVGVDPPIRGVHVPPLRPDNSFRGLHTTRGKPLREEILRFPVGASGIEIGDSSGARRVQKDQYRAAR